MGEASLENFLEAKSWWHGFPKENEINAKCHCLSNTATTDPWAGVESLGKLLSQQGWKEGPGVGAGSRTWAGRGPRGHSQCSGMWGLPGDTLVVPPPTYSIVELFVLWRLSFPGKVCS